MKGSANERKHSMDSQLKSIEVNGTQLHYVEAGEGDPVILVHGSVNDFRTWSAQMEALATRYHVIAYSRRDHYPNPWDDSSAEYSGLAHAEDLAALIKALGLGPAHLQGNSYGAYMSLLVAVRHPDLVRTLVLGEPPILAWLADIPGGSALIGEFMAGSFMPASEAFRNGNLEQGVRTFIDGVIGRGSFDQMPPPVRQMLLDNAPEMKLETSTNPEVYLPAVSCEEAGSIKVPTLLVKGEISPTMFHLIVDELQRCMPNATQVTIPGASHAIHGMNPQAYNEAVLAFLAKH
jgi:pimeloyl-ACP methyl ester carboxylesterase